MNEMPLGSLMVDVQGTTLTDADKALLCRPAVGGVILFARNFESKDQLRGLIAGIKALRTPSLLVAVDQEGGRIQRFKDGFFELPAAADIGNAYNKDVQKGIALARGLGELMAGELLALGVDFSFAPVLDIGGGGGEVIGDRAFHANPESVAVLAGAFIDGMGDAGMAATGKHFPGHGGVSEDSHECLPVDNRGMDDLLAADLLPYRDLSTRLGGIMTAHVRYPQIDTALPSYSYYWLQTVLRKNLGFEGAIFSDDLSMAGAEIGGQPGARAAKAITAGCDMVLVCNDRESAEEAANELEGVSPTNPQRLELMRGTRKRTGVETAVLKARLSSELNS